MTDPQAGAWPAARPGRASGLSYLLITHDVEVIRAMAHQVIVMKDGAILEAGPVDRVLDARSTRTPGNLVAAALIDG